MKLKKCPEHGYTLSGVCRICKKETKSAHYKFIKTKSAKTISPASQAS